MLGADQAYEGLYGSHGGRMFQQSKFELTFIAKNITNHCISWNKVFVTGLKSYQ